MRDILMFLGRFKIKEREEVMSVKGKRIVLGLISLYCLGGFGQVEAEVRSPAELAATGGIVTTDATGLTPIGGNALGIWNPGITFVYPGDVQVNITGYDPSYSPVKCGILSSSTGMILGKTTLIWRNDAANTEISSAVYGVGGNNKSPITLGNGSRIDIQGNSTAGINGVFSNDSGAISIRFNLGDQTAIILKNDGGEVRGIYTRYYTNFLVGENLYINVEGKGNATGVSLDGVNSSASLGSNGTIIANSRNGNAYGVNIGKGLFTAQENVTIQATSAGDAYGIYLSNGASEKAYLNGATISASTSSSTGSAYSLYAIGASSKIEGYFGKYDIKGDMGVNTNGAIAMDFDKGSSFTGASKITNNGTIDYKMDGTTWNMTGDSAVTSLALSGDASNIIFAGDSAFKTLTIGDLSGTGGNFAMRTDLVGDGAGNNAGDFLDVTGTSAGNHTVTVQNNGSANATGDETLTIIRTADGVAEFSNTNTVELGGYEYNLREVAGSNKKEWELFGAKKETPMPASGGSSKTGSAAVNLFAGSYLLNYAETQTLMKRMGDLRDGKENGNVWGRVYGGKFHSDSDHFLKDFDMNYTGVQVGADKKFVREDGKGVVYLGGFFGYTKGDVDYGYGSGDLDSKSLGAYWTHMHHNGFYADAVLKYGWMKNDFDVRDSQGNRVTGDDISTRGFTGSLEVGRRYHFDQKEKNGWYVEPQAQLTVSHQNGDHFTASNGLNVKVDSFRSVMGRVGAHVGYEVKGGKNPINLYGKVSVVKEFDGDVDYSFNSSPETTSYKDTWVVYGVGATAKLGTRHNLYLDVERATGGQFTQSWAVNGGYRYAW